MKVDVKNDSPKQSIEHPSNDGNITIATDSNAANGETETETLIMGFQKIEAEIIKLHDNLVGIDDESLNQMKDSMNKGGSKKPKVGFEFSSVCFPILL